MDKTLLPTKTNSPPILKISPHPHFAGLPMTTTTTTTSLKTKKLCRADDHDQQHQPLIPGLPDHLAQDCLSRLPPSLLFSVSHSWRNLIYSPSFPPFLSLYALLAPLHHPDSIHFSSFDPLSSSWHPLPPPPSPLLLRRHPSFIARDLPIQSITISGHLALVAGTTTHHLLPALPHPLLFNPLTSQWLHGPPISPPRRWCAVGSVSGSVYIASGVGSSYNQEVARSAERWSVVGGKRSSKWEKVAPVKYGGTFCREAVEAVGWRGKLCMVNVKGNAAKVGVVYDVEKDRWEDMSGGMLKGWVGPVVALDEETMFVVDEERGVLERYDEERDCWEVVAVEERLKGAVQMAAGGGRVCVVGGDGVVVVVDVVAPPCGGRAWVVEPPEGTNVVAVHVLPRLCKSPPED